jgi:hypothetical protein
VTATPVSGSTSLGVVVNNDVSPSTRFPLCGSPCTPASIVNYHWSSAYSPIRARATVLGGSPFWATGRQYVVGVWAGGPARYAVTAAFLNSTVLLQSGVPVAGGIGQGQYAYYRLDVLRPNSDVLVQVRV